MNRFYKVVLFSLFSFFISHSVFAQYKLVGKISGSDNKALPFCNIQLLSPHDSSLIAFATSDYDGSYTVLVKQADKYLAKVSFVGYQTRFFYVDFISCQCTKIKKNIVLPVSENKLSEVVIKAGAVDAKVTKDTISYNIKKFSDGTEQNVKDILEKLPGIEVGKDGKIKANGKAVDKLLINGVDFLSNQQKVATQSLAAKMVENIDLYNNYDDPSQIAGFNNGNLTALNIKIKDEYRNRLVGDITLLGGAVNKYDEKANLFLFGKRTMFSFVSNINNSGQQVFTLMDYLNLINFQRMMNSLQKGNFELDENVYRMISNDQNAQWRNTQFGIVNMRHQSKNNKLTIKAYAVLDHVQQQDYRFSIKNFLSDLVANSIDSINSKRKSLLASTSLDIMYKPSENTSWSYVVNYSPNFNAENSGIVNNINGQIINYFMDNKMSSAKTNHYFEFAHKYNEKLRQISSLRYSLSQNATTDYMSSNFPFFNFVFAQDTNWVVQTSLQTQSELVASTNFDYKIKQQTISLSFNFSNIGNNYKNRLSILDKQKRATFFDRRFNDTVFWQTKYFSSILGLSKPFGLLSYNFSTRLVYLQNAFNNKQFNQLIFEPSLSIRLNFANWHSLSFRYSQKNRSPDINELTNGYFLNDYLSVLGSRLSPDLLSRYNNFRLYYHILDGFSGTEFNLTANFQIKKEDIVFDNLYDNSLFVLQSTTAHYQNALDTKVELSKSMGKIPLTVKLKIKYRRYNNVSYVESVSEKNYLDEKTIDFKLFSRFQSSVNFDLGLIYNFRNITYENENQNSDLHTLIPYLRVKGLAIEKRLTWNAYLSYEKFQTNSFEDQYWITNFWCSYRPVKSKFEFHIQAQNILNLFSYEKIRNITNSLYIEEYRSSVLPGYIMAGVKYIL